MRYLGIDFGTKRIGLAISDEEGKIAFLGPQRDMDDIVEAFGKVAKNIDKLT